jgi:hypothetical protein
MAEKTGSLKSADNAVRLKIQEAMNREGVEYDTTQDNQLVTVRSETIRTLDEALLEAEVDLSLWEVERWIANKWDMAAKVGHKDEEIVQTTELWQVKVWLRRKTPTICSLESILDKIEENSPFVPLKYKPAKKPSDKRALEVDIFDPHYGMQCFRPAADAGWSLEDCERIVLWAIDELIALSKGHAPFQEIVFPFGNDFLHSDNIQHTTSGGTQMVESLSWHHVYQCGEELAIKMVERLLTVAPVKILLVPGNHARQSEFTLARLLRAYYRNNKNVEVDASSRPYKFWNFGVNLIGFEHGHSVNQSRLAALMANETRDRGWKDARWCEWHLGDQHRKGSGKPSTLEEQGVSVEFLAGLTPPNEWHVIKGFNYQKRCANGFVYDYERGPMARYQVNLDSYTGDTMGRKPA